MKKIHIVITLIVSMLLFSVAVAADKPFTLTAEKNVIFLGETTSVKPETTDSNISLDGITYTSTAYLVATVDENGIVTAKKTGVTTIYAVTADNRHKTGTRIYVEVRPESMAFTEENVKVAVGKSTSLRVEFTPRKTTNKKVTWTSSDESIATISSTGKLVAVSEGDCEITATSQTDPNVSVTMPVRSVVLTKSLAFEDAKPYCIVGKTYATKLIFSEDATDHEVVYTSSNTKVATVDEFGVITGVKAGKATITAKATDGSRKHAQCTIQITQPVLGVHAKRPEVRIAVSYYSTAEAVLEPSNSTNKNMTWYSNDESIATVKGTNNRPRITAHAWGETTVVGTTEDGNYTCEILVHGGSYRFAVKVYSAKVRNGKPSLVLKNYSNLDIAEVRYQIRGFDKNLNPVQMSVNSDDIYVLKGTYDYMLAPEEKTVHGQFSFRHKSNFPNLYGISVAVTGITTTDGFTFNTNPSGYNWITSKQ